MHINLVFECWLGHNAYDTKDVLFCNFSYVVCSEVACMVRDKMSVYILRKNS